MITFLTIVLDGMPWLPQQLSMMQRLTVPWKWVVVEGVAEPLKDTGWCQRIPPRLSNDGTTEWLQELNWYYPNLIYLAAESWPGKTAMCNAGLELATEPGLLWQLDADELWLPHQVETMALAFDKNRDRHWASFWCQYLVGPNLRIATRDTYGNHSAYEWLRVWRYTPGQLFEKHEPPILIGTGSKGFSNQETEAMGCVFLHPAYMLEKQVAFKEQYYRYPGAVEGWRRLQQNMDFPCPLRNYFPWVKDGALVERIA